MALPPDDRRLAAYLVESETLPLDRLLPAIEEAHSSGDLSETLIRRSLLELPEIDRLRAEVDRIRPSNWRKTLDDGTGHTLVTDVSGLLSSTPSKPITLKERARTVEIVDGEPRARHFLPEVSLSEPPTAEERYAIAGEIGRGGMGRILRAHDNVIGREVALKVMLDSSPAAEIDLRRFWMEVQATGQLEHPAIIPVHDVGRLPSGELFYVMKLLSGRTLAEVINGLKRGVAEVVEEMPRTRLLTLFQQIAYAMAFAHARRVMHRDLKPANIMIGRYGEVTILDWGLAKFVSVWSLAPDAAPPAPIPRSPKISGSDTAEGTVTGTPQYMAPEAVEGHPERITEKADVYGLGAVLYEILTLEPAYADRGFVQTLLDVRMGAFVPPRTRTPERGITLEIEELCLQAMSADPLDRPSAKELADHIGTILEGTKERERRIEEARTRVREGSAALDRWRILKEELGELDHRVRELAKSVAPWAPSAEKAPVWELEDRASRLRIEAIGAFEEAEAGFLRALGEVPDDRDARNFLATLYFDRFSEAEKTHDIEGQRYFRSLVTRYDDGAWQKLLAGYGTLSVRASIPGTEVSIARLAAIDRVLKPMAARSYGQVPIDKIELPIGSYLVTLTPPKGRVVLRPVGLSRLEHVDAFIRIQPDEALGDEFVHVPAGPAILGGDPVAHGSRERRVVHVPDFAIAKYPVTCAEYLEFVTALATEDVATAMRRVPRALPTGGQLWSWNGKAFDFPAASWAPRLPIVAVSFADAMAYVAWRSGRTGERLRLPSEDEWEKAARGVDGRFYPWGDHFDPSFCKMKDSRQGPSPEREPVGAFPIDRSPYGAFDFAGGVREMCLSSDRGEPVMRGGCWHDTGLFCRLAFRHPTKHDFVNTGLGFRWVKDLD